MGVNVGMKRGGGERRKEERGGGRDVCMEHQPNGRRAECGECEWECVSAEGYSSTKNKVI